VSVYIDTSAFFAVLDRDDSQHAAAETVWIRLIQEDMPLVCANYVLVEASALIQRRLGPKALHVFQEDIVPILRIYWVDESTHKAAVEMLFTSKSRSLSLVDCVSFVVMRRLGLRTAFAFDKHFQSQGFICLTGAHAG
jgi:predicted nucleic acid-binding protein